MVFVVGDIYHGDIRGYVDQEKTEKGGKRKYINGSSSSMKEEEKKMKNRRIKLTCLSPLKVVLRRFISK